MSHQDLGLTGEETFDIVGLDDSIKPGEQLTVTHSMGKKREDPLGDRGFLVGVTGFEPVTSAM